MKIRLIEFVMKHVFIKLLDLLISTNILKWYKLIAELRGKKTSEICDWQFKRLKFLLKHAYNNTVYYRRLFDNLNLQPNDILSLNDLNKIPPLSKQDIKKNFENIKARNIKKIPHFFKSTGGSTGDPLQYILDRDSWSFIFANRLQAWEKIGYTIGQRYVALGSSSLFPINKRSIKNRLYNLLIGRIPVNAVNLSDQKLEIIVTLLQKRKIRYIFGYSSALYLLAKYVITNNIYLKHIKGCISTSEILLENYRETIIQAFNCKIIDAYGAYDGGINAYKIFDDFYKVGYNCYIETKKTNIEKIDNELLTTDLLNFAFPFIRYSIGDEAIISNKGIKNYKGQTITKLMGRTPDIIKLSNGNILTGPGFTILFKDLNVDAYRIVQKTELEITCQILVNKSFVKKEEILILNTLKKHAGKECIINIEYVKDFKILDSGKLGYFISN